MKLAKIADYGITEEFGYLPAHDPAQSLSTGNEEWDQFGKDLPKLLMGTNFRKRVQALPKFNIDKLNGEAEIQRAMLGLGLGLCNDAASISGILCISLIGRGIGGL